MFGQVLEGSFRFFTKRLGKAFPTISLGLCLHAIRRKLQNVHCGWHYFNHVKCSWCCLETILLINESDTKFRKKLDKEAFKPYPFRKTWQQNVR